MLLRSCALSIALVGGLSAADTLRDNVGVSLGTIIFEGNDGLLSQICAATTNGIFSSQTFAITRHLEARDFDGFVNRRKVEDYVKDNMDTLAREMATGQGETLTGLASLMGVEEAAAGLQPGDEEELQDLSQAGCRPPERGRNIYKFTRGLNVLTGLDDGV